MHGLLCTPAVLPSATSRAPHAVVSTQQTRRSTIRSGVNQVTTEAIFKTKTKDPVPQDVAVEKKRGLFGRGAPKKTTASQKSSTKVIDKAAEYKKRQGFLGSVVGSFDFAEVRSKSDAELLYDARYGKLKDGKMTREQYQALRRKVGGTAKDYWKDWVEVKGEYTDKGYVSESSDGVVGLPFLIAVVAALFGTAAYVVSQTS